MTSPTVPAPGSLGARTTSGVAWTTIQKWVVRVTGFATIAVLARALDPQDFGLVAAASTVPPLLYLLSDLGFSTYVETAASIDRRMLSTAFWFSATAGVVFALGLVAAAPFVAEVLHAPGLVHVLPVMSIAVVIVALTAVPSALLRRQMQFRKLALQSAAASFLSQAVAVAVALGGGGVWALVAQLLVSLGVVAVLSWISARWLPALAFSPREFITMARFGINVVGIEFIDLARQWAETALITTFFGVTGLGYLNIAQRLAQVGQDLTVSAITPVTTVAFAKLRDSVERLRSGYTRVMEVTYAAAVPFVAVLAVASSAAVPLIYGDAWGSSVRPAEAYAVASFAVVGAVVDKAFFFGIGKPGNWLIYGLATDAVTLATTAVMVHISLAAVPLGFVGVAFAALITRSIMVSRLLGAPYRVIAAPVLRAVAVGLPSAAAGFAVMQVVGGLPHVLALAFTGIVVTAVYLLLGRVLLRQPHALAWDLVGRILRVRARRSRPTSEVEPVA